MSETGKGRQVAVVGAGLSGMSCARELRQAGWTVTVFEKSRGPGGRMSTRRGLGTSFDHGAQYFTAQSTEFQKQVRQWQLDGWVAPWDGRFAKAGMDGMEPWAPRRTRWVGVPGMNVIPRIMGAGLEVKYRCEVSALCWEDGQWCVSHAQSSEPDRFDAVVLSCPGPQTAALCPPDSEVWKSAMRIRFEPCWAVMASSQQRTRTDFDGIEWDSGSLRWAARENSKPGRNSAERWVLHASPEWSQTHLEASVEYVASRLVQDLQRWIPLEVEEVMAHRWRYARCDSESPQPYVWEPNRSLGFCGDGLVGPRVESAWMSGTSLARHMVQSEINGR